MKLQLPSAMWHKWIRLLPKQLHQLHLQLGLFTADELNRTDLQQVDPITRRVHWSRTSVMTWLAAVKLGQLMLSQLMRSEPLLISCCNYNHSHSLPVQSLDCVTIQQELDIYYKSSIIIMSMIIMHKLLYLSLQCSDAVGWAAGRASGL